MRRGLLRATALIVLLLLCLTACSSGTVVMEYGKTTVTANMYQYWASAYKGVFSYSYADYVDNDSFWGMELPGGGTVLAYLDSLVLDNVKRTMVCSELYDKMGYRLADSVYEEIDGRLDRLEEDYAGGNRNSFNEILATYGVNRKILREIYVMEAKVDGLKKALFQAGGPLELTDSGRKTYYEENYARVQLLLINDAYKYKVSEDGHYYYDETTGTYITEALTEAELAVKKAKITAVDAALADGGDFYELMEKYSETGDYYGDEEPYPNGYYLTPAMDFIPEVTVAAFEMAEGEVKKVETDDGTFYLLREKLDEKAWAEKENADFFPDYDETVKQAAYLDYLSPYLGDVTVEKELIAAYTLKNVTANYRY